MTKVRVGDVWQGWRTAYRPDQPRDDHGRWTDGGGGGTLRGDAGKDRLGGGSGEGGKSIQDYARSVGVLGPNAAKDFDYAVKAARKVLGSEFDAAYNAGNMKAILDAAAKDAATDGEFDALEKLYGHLKIKSPWD